MHQVGPEQPSGQREGGDPAGRVGRVRADAAGGQPQPLPQRPLLGRQVGPPAASTSSWPGRRPAAPRRSPRRGPRARSAGSSGPAERRNTTRAPSAATVTARGAPRVKRRVRAASSGYSTPIASCSQLAGKVVRTVAGVSTTTVSRGERTVARRDSRRCRHAGCMFVHAHPDDESIGTGATMAHYAAAGAHVTLVTCTLGEEGEIHVPELAGLAAAEADQLGGYRIAELAARLRRAGRDRPPLPRRRRPLPRLRHDGPADQRAPARVLAGRPRRGRRPPGRDHARGPAAGAGHVRPERLLRPPRPHPGAPGRDAGGRAGRGRGLRPGEDLLDGDAAQRAARPASRRSRELDRQPVRRRRATSTTSRSARPTTRSPPGSTAPTTHDAKVAALRAHATQIPDNSWLYSIAGNFGSEFMGVEYYTLAYGQRGAGRRPVRLGERPVRGRWRSDDTAARRRRRPRRDSRCCPTTRTSGRPVEPGTRPAAAARCGHGAAGGRRRGAVVAAGGRDGAASRSSTRRCGSAAC